MTIISSQCLFGYHDKMAAFRRTYDIQPTMETLDNPAITLFEIDGIWLRLDYLTRTLVNLDSNCTPTDDIAHLLGEAISYLQDMDVQLTACSFQLTPIVFSGGRGRPSFEIKEGQLSFLIDQGFQVPVIAKLFRSIATNDRKKNGKIQPVNFR